MDIILLLIVVSVVFLGAIFYFNKSEPTKSSNTSDQPIQDSNTEVPTTTQQPVETVAPSISLDVNNDGKVNIKDAVEVVKKTRTRVKKVLDQNGDGKVTVKDAKVAAKKVKEKTKAAIAKTTRGRKPASKKS